MTTESDSARLVWVEAVLALAAAESQLEAASLISDGVNASTIKRRIQKLEMWLKRDLFSWDKDLLIDGEEDEIVISNRSEFIPVAWQIYKLIDAGNLRGYLSETRVMPDGQLTVQDRVLRTNEAIEIGRLMVANRAVKPIGYREPASVCAKDIDVDALLAESADRAPAD